MRRAASSVLLGRVAKSASFCVIVATSIYSVYQPSRNLCCGLPPRLLDQLAAPVCGSELAIAPDDLAARDCDRRPSGKGAARKWARAHVRPEGRGVDGSPRARIDQDDVGVR